jgi:hypothetical protein
MKYKKKTISDSGLCDICNKISFATVGCNKYALQPMRYKNLKGPLKEIICIPNWSPFFHFCITLLN